MTDGKAIRTRPHDNKRPGYMIPSVRKRVLKSLELYLEGNTWAKIAKMGGYDWRTFSYKMLEYPDLAKSYAEARRSSGHSFEDKAITLAEELTGANEFTGSQVQAHKAAMEQYRWSASRRNPAEYAEAGAKQLSVVVPIQINSSLDLATTPGESKPPSASIWEVHAEVLREPQGALPEPESVPEVESDGQETENPSEAALDPLEAVAARLGLPDRVESAIPKRPSSGRPRKKHKSAYATGVTRGAYARMKKSPTVMRALGLEETKDVAPVDAGDQPAGPKPTSRS